jgi:hypothetical protein
VRLIGVLLQLGLVCACYSPHYADCFVTCASSQACPSGFSCELGFCRDHSNQQSCTEVLGDAALGSDSGGGIDASSATDTDGDGVPNAQDNCPSASNPAQDNEDMDTFGDVCDPCPPFAMAAINGVLTDANIDTDGDGVGEGCDPNLNPGVDDHITFFHGFNTKPPAPAVVAEPTAATWSFSGTAKLSTTSTNDYGTIGISSPADRRATEVWSQVMYSMPNGVNNGAGPVAYTPASSLTGGEGCMIWSGTAGELLALVAFPSTVQNSSTTFDRSIPMVLKLHNNTNSGFFSCVHPTGAFNNGTQGSSNQPANSLEGIRAIGSSAAFYWVMVVD